MKRGLRFAAIAVAALVLLLVGATVFVAATFDPNDLKPRLVEHVQRTQQRTLAIPGDLGLSFWPRPAVRLGAATLSERGSAAPFASFASARLSMAWAPLLRGQVQVGRVEVEGLRLTVRRERDGRTNVDDLLGKADPTPPSTAPASAPGGTPLALDIAGIGLRDAVVVFDDRQGGRRVELAGRVDVGRVAAGAPGQAELTLRVRADKPALVAELKAKGGYAVTPEGRWRLDDVAASLAGLLDGQPIDVRLKLPKLARDGERLAAEGLQADVKRGAGTDAMQFALGVPALSGSAQALELPALTLTLDGPLALRAEGHARLDLRAEKVSSRLSGRLDGSNFQATLGVERFAAPAFRFDIAVDRLDLDRRRAAAASASPASAARGGGDAPLDLTPLQGLDARGQLRIARLEVGGLQASDVRVGVRAAGGRLDLEPLTAQLYGGRTSGSASAVAARPARLALRQTLTGVAVGPLLQDLAGQDRVTGRGDVHLDVTAQGTSAAALKSSLAGQARLALRDGAVRGFDIARAVRSARATLGAAAGAAGSGSAREATDFSELTATLRIAVGVARNDDLQAKSPLLRVSGAGDIDLARSRLDYRVKATVVDTLQGQGGPELQALRGRTIPVRLSGPFSDIGWRVDVADLVQDAARRKVEKELKGRVEDKLGERLKGLFGR